MAETIFYSWQSALPNATNRGFIEVALEKAVRSLRNDDSLQVEPVIDRDTLGAPGTPDIAVTILNKIDGAQVFVGDVSIINSLNVNPDWELKMEANPLANITSSVMRPTPNPNVLVELGYALKALGPSRIVMVQNIAYGGPELLPFDLRMKRVLTYRASPTDTSKAEERTKLERTLAAALRDIFVSGVVERDDERHPPIPLNRQSLYSYVTRSRRVRRLDEQIAEMYAKPLDASKNCSLWMLEQAEYFGLQTVAELDATVKECAPLVLSMASHRRPEGAVHAGYSVARVMEVLAARLGSEEKIAEYYKSLKWTSGGYGRELLDLYEQARLYNEFESKDFN